MDTTPDDTTPGAVHDPPDTGYRLRFGVPLSREEVRMPYALGEYDPQVTADRARQLVSPAYRLLASQLLAAGLRVDPLDLVRAMAEGRWRWRRTRELHLETDDTPEDEGGPQPVPELMSFRNIAAELEWLTGELVSHETLRRWWATIWPDDPAPNQGLYADRGRKAGSAGAAPSTAPGVPPAKFLPPAA